MVEQATRAKLKTPKAAALAGIVFAILLLIAFGILLNAIQPRTADTGAWARERAQAVETLDGRAIAVSLAGDVRTLLDRQGFVRRS